MSDLRGQVRGLLCWVRFFLLFILFPSYDADFSCALSVLDLRLLITHPESLSTKIWLKNQSFNLAFCYYWDSFWHRISVSVFLSDWCSCFSSRTLIWLLCSAIQNKTAWNHKNSAPKLRNLSEKGRGYDQSPWFAIKRSWRVFFLLLFFCKTVQSTYL